MKLRIKSFMQVYPQEFLDWVDGGCCISWPETGSRRQTPTVSISYAHDNSSVSPLKRNGSDVGDIRLPHMKSQPSESSLQSSRSSSLMSSPKRLAFFHRLVREDIAPALDFADNRLCEALRLALDHLGVEMEPLSSLSITSTTNETPTCPLVPGEPIKFGLKLEVSLLTFIVDTSSRFFCETYFGLTSQPVHILVGTQNNSPAFYFLKIGDLMSEYGVAVKNTLSHRWNYFYSVILLIIDSFVQRHVEKSLIHFFLTFFRKQIAI